MSVDLLQAAEAYRQMADLLVALDAAQKSVEEMNAYFGKLIDAGSEADQ